MCRQACIVHRRRQILQTRRNLSDGFELATPHQRNRALFLGVCQMELICRHRRAPSSRETQQVKTLEADWSHEDLEIGSPRSASRRWVHGAPWIGLRSALANDGVVMESRQNRRQIFEDLTIRNRAMDHG